MLMHSALFDASNIVGGHYFRFHHMRGLRPTCPLCSINTPCPMQDNDASVWWRDQVLLQTVQQTDHADANGFKWSYMT